MHTHKVYKMEFIIDALFTGFVIYWYILLFYYNE